MKVIIVSAVALIDRDGRVLIAQRPSGKSMEGLWEFPGGKVASHGYSDFHLLMPLFACRKWEGTPKAKEGQNLKWVHVNSLKEFPMPAADIPLISVLRDWL